VKINDGIDESIVGFGNGNVEGWYELGLIVRKMLGL
jgi:hypothetical protein